MAAGALALVAFGTQCGDGSSEGSGVPETTTTILERETTTTTTIPGPDLVVNRRSITSAEAERIEDDDGTGALDCPNYGGVTWDYGSIEDDAALGRRPDDALLDAIRDLNEDAAVLLPESGWTELVEDRGRSTFVQEEGDWRALIVVQGDDDAGIWRHTSATICSGSS